MQASTQYHLTIRQVRYMLDFSHVVDRDGVIWYREEVGSKLVAAFEAGLATTNSEGAAPLKLYLLTIPDPTDVPYLSLYDFCLVAAYNEDEARLIHPMNNEWRDDMWDKLAPWGDYYWVPRDKVDLIEVTEVGTANSNTVSGVIRASLRHA